MVSVLGSSAVENRANIILYEREFSTRQVQLVEPVLPTLPEHLRSLQISNGTPATQLLVFLLSWVVFNVL
jgi:hypothetical protein